RLGIRGQCAEQRPIDIADLQRAEPVRTHLEARIEPTLASDAAAERDRRQAAVKPVAPLMVDADVIGGVAAELAPHERPAMGATVDEGPDGASLVAVEDDRHLADIARAEITGFGNLGLEPEKAPDRPAEDPLLLARIKRSVVIEPIGHPAVVERRPNCSGYHGFSRIVEIGHLTSIVIDEARADNADARLTYRPTIDISLPAAHPLAMSVALAAIDPSALRPHSDRTSQLLRTETWIHQPVRFHGGGPEIRAVFLLRAARDPESNRLLVTSYTHSGLAFEAEDFADAMRRAVQIVPDFAIAAGLGADGIAIVLDEYPSINDLDLR